ncbi:SipW-dependent-type signal peptide-containing protein [Rhodococcus pyridinivorans]|uniref:SipW-dependent-type signal peptide-containing protein n=1 Tax=Rhodococcus pyridinivorans TaxID=103816 RepID=UPI00200B9156|nr:SipW-dependent-type signal peptide-containing protein [Rhodococcus pyridinivorans]UPW03055.1 SipW-dependent-type signal peptide-containing protein [Rhodococcus pyridinivorans]
MTSVDPTRKRRKIRAVLASGLVLGVGAAVTLAAWSDTVWGSSEFGTGGSSFNIQGSFDGGSTWAEYLTADAAGTMTFTQQANALVPAEPVYQLVGLQEVEGNFGADITVTKTNADTSALANLVTVRVAELGTGAAAPACGAGAPFGAGTTIGAASTQVLSTTVGAGDYRWLCFSAELAANAPATAAVTSAPILWEFAATSTDV